MSAPALNLVPSPHAILANSDLSLAVFGCVLVPAAHLRVQGIAVLRQDLVGLTLFFRIVGERGAGLPDQWFAAGLVRLLLRPEMSGQLSVETRRD